MRRIVGLLALLLVTATPKALPQGGAGAELWRLAAVTMPLPTALATGSTAAFWNPAQSDGTGRVGVDLVQTPQAIGATGLITALRLRAGRLGSVGVFYARLSLGDLIHTTDSPDRDGSIPFYTQRAALSWAHDLGHSTIGIAASYQDTKLDATTSDHWTLDVGVAQRIGDRLRVAAATRGLRRMGSDPSQDMSAGIEYQVWRGTLWRTTPGSVLTRYGISAGRPAGVDHQFGLGLNVGTPVSLDVVLVREAGYGHTAWRGAAGFRIAVGRYRMTFARDGGISDLGSSFRVGIEARLR